MAKRLETTHIIIHTAAWPGDPSAEDIDRAHKQRGWAGIGYHFVVRKQGLIENGRPVQDVGAHASQLGMNRKSVGIVLSGHHDQEEPTAIQMEALLGLIQGLRERYNIPAERVLGHRELGAAKTCPGTKVSMEGLRAELKRLDRLGGRKGQSFRPEPRPPVDLPSGVPGVPSHEQLDEVHMPGVKYKTAERAGLINKIRAQIKWGAILLVLLPLINLALGALGLPQLTQDDVVSWAAFFEWLAVAIPVVVTILIGYFARPKPEDVPVPDPKR